MGKNWHYLFLVAAFLAVLFPPVLTDVGMQITTRFVFVYSAINSGARAMPYNWPILFASEAVLLTAFLVLAADKRVR